MADDTKGKAPDPKKIAESTEAVKKFAASQRDFTNAIGPNIKALEDWDLGLDKTRADQERLTDVIKEQYAAIKQHAQQVGSLQSQFKDLGGAATSYLTKLKETISLTNIYNVAIKKIQVGQQAYNASLQASTSSLGKAAHESTRFIDAYNETLMAARKTATAYNLDMEEMEGNFTNVYKAIAEVTNAYPDMTKATVEASTAIFKFSRRMGVDFSQAQEYMTNRINGSVKSLDEVRKEMLMVTKSADTYMNKIKDMGDAARQAGTVTKQGFLKVLQEIEQMFKGGLYTAAEGFAKTTSTIMLKAKEMGFTPDEAKDMASSFGKVFGDMAKFDNIFGARVAQHLGEIIKDVSQIQDKNLQIRLSPYIERAQAGTLNVQDFKGIADAARGSSEGTRILLKTFRESGMAPDVMRAVLGEAMGPGKQHEADAMTKLIQEGKLEEAFQKMGIAGEEQKKEEEKQLNFWEMSMDELIKEGHTATKAQWQAAIEIKKLSDRIFEWFKNYPLLMMGIMAAAQLGGNVLGGLLARLGLGAAGAGAAGAGAGAAGAVGLGGLVAAPLVGYAAYKATDWASKAFYNRFASGGHISGETQRRLGPNAGLGDLAGKSLAENLPGVGGFLSNMGSALGSIFSGKSVGKYGAGYSKEGMEMLKETTGIRGVLTEAHRKEFEQNAKLIDHARKNWEKLDEKSREAIEQKEKHQAELLKHIKTYTSTPEERKADTKRLTEAATKEMLANLGGGEMVMRGDTKGLEDLISNAVGQTGRIGSVQMGAKALDVGALTEAIMRSGAAQPLLAKFSEAQIRAAIERQVVTKQHAFGAEDYARMEGKSPQERERLAAESMQKQLAAGGLSKYSTEVIRAATSVAGGGSMGGSQVNIGFEGGGEAAEGKLVPGADGKMRWTLPTGTLVIDANGASNWLAGDKRRNAPGSGR